MTNLEEITEIVIWFRELPYNYNGLADLMHNRQRLTGYLYSFADEMAAHRKKWANSKYLLEKGKNQKRAQFIDKGTTKADYLARANTAAEFEADAMDEAIFWGMKDIYDAAMEVSQAMAQSISQVKKEWELEKFQDHNR